MPFGWFCHAAAHLLVTLWKNVLSLFLECDAIQSAKKAAKAWKKKQQTPVVGDIGALADSLPTIDLLLKGNTGPKDNV